MQFNKTEASTALESFGATRSSFGHTYFTSRKTLQASTLQSENEISKPFLLEQLNNKANLPNQSRRIKNKLISNIFNNKEYQIIINKTNDKHKGEQLFFQAKLQKNARISLQQYDEELNTMKKLAQFDGQTGEQHIKKYVIDNQQQLDNLCKMTNKIMLNRYNRGKCEQLMKEMTVDVFKQRNIGLQQQIFYNFGKIEKLYLNPIQAAVYFKQCKRLSDSENYYRMKMKAYRGIGECLLRIRPQLGKLYITKYLMISWKLNEVNNELHAYELLGKYYYYMGQIDKAREFHEKMMSGNAETQDSRVRQLALRRLEHSTNNHKTISDNKQVYIDIDVVTSDDECYDIVLTEQNQIQVQPKLSVNIPLTILRGKPNLKMIRDEGNSNIRQRKVDNRGHTSGDISTERFRQGRRQQFYGQLKDRILVSHQTSNRKLEEFQYMGLATDKTSYQNSSLLTGFNDRFEQKKITRQIDKVVILLKCLREHLNKELMIYQQVGNQVIVLRRNAHIVN